MAEQFIAACMGGWCQKRNDCARYVAPFNRNDPGENMCKNGANAYLPISFSRSDFIRENSPATRTFFSGS